MSASAQLLFGQSNLLWIGLFGSVLIVIQVWFSYHAFESVIKWLTLALFAYVVAAFVVHPPWPIVMRHLFLPELHFHAIWLTTLVAVLGTTITPYLFFWQASLEVEEEIELGRTTVASRRGATTKEISDMHLDVNSGMVLSNAVAFFIIVTTAATIGANGFHQITTPPRRGARTRAARRPLCSVALRRRDDRHGTAGHSGIHGLFGLHHLRGVRFSRRPR